MKNHWTKKECDMFIDYYKDKTAYFGNTLSGEPMRFNEIYDMLRYRMRFGEAETMIIIACIIKCGGKIV